MEERKNKKLKKTPIRKTSDNLKSSFRDPSGFIFTQNGEIFRQINEVYKSDYELLMSSGLYEELVSENLLIPHVEVEKHSRDTAWKVIKPQQIPFISYPYEWAFSMVKDAALATLEIQKRALAHGMSLKDASAFNIQFVEGHPVLIDTLSFETYEEGKPWVAYKQFVEHFLTPLALMAYIDVRLNRMSAVYLDGIPVDLAASMLPFKSKFNLRLLFHIFAHATSQKKYSNKKIGKDVVARKFSKHALMGLLDNLEGAVKSLSWNPAGTEWEDYYEEDKNNYKSESLKHKGELVESYLKSIKAKQVWDMGANTGYFSRIAKNTGAQVLSFDIDFGAIEKNYRDIKKHSEKNMLPLFSDLTNPTPSVGWENNERLSLFERGSADCVMALAFIHHLAIPHNIPFAYLAETFSKMGSHVIVEYIEKDDSQVQILLANRKDVFDHYTKNDFEQEFEKYFKILKATPIKNSKRTLYLMQKKP